MRLPHLVFAAAGIVAGLSSATSALAAPFTYQGLLKDSSGGAATYDFQVTVFEVQNGDNVVAGPLLFNDVAVDEGRFTLLVDPGVAVFNGAERWLQIGVRRGSESGAFTTLMPRQRVHATPYAQHAEDADFAALVAPGSVTSLELADGSVSSLELAAEAVGSDQLATGAVNAIKLALGAVDSSAIADASVGTVDLTDTAVTTSKIFPNAVGVGQIDATQVQRRVGGATGSCTVGAAVRAINEDGSVVCEPIPSTANLWSLTGNDGTTPGTHYLGTTDAQPFEIRTQNRRHFRLEPSAALSGGAPITANVIAGSHGNAVSPGARGATIAGGGTPQFINDPDLGYGDPNIVAGHYGTVGGGLDNRAGGENAVNFFTFPFATVGGGVGNLAAANSATIAGGFSNTVYGSSATVSGGGSNTAWGTGSMVLGGSNNCAGGDSSLAAGSGAAARPSSDPGIGGACGSLASYPNNGSGDSGTFVWADASGFGFLSTGSNRFEVRATGGVRFVTGINASGVPDAGVKLDADDNAWEVLSDRNAKAGIAAVAPAEVLARLLALPIYTWHYTSQGATTQHIGPMAQDFHAAFGFNGDDDRHISTLDPDGVALAAIQGVYAHFDSMREADAARIAALELDNAAMRATLRRLERRLRALEASE